MLRRTLGRGAVCRALGLVCCLSTLPSASFAQATKAEPTLAAELTRVSEVNQRRRALTLAIARQRTELTRAAQRAEQLRTQLDDPAQSVEAAPALRAKLLDQRADALGDVVYLTGQLQSGHAEQSELEAELSELLAGADAQAAGVDASQRMAAMKAKQRAVMLKTRAKLGPALATPEKQVKLAEELAAWRQQQQDATRAQAAVAAEPRFASLTATPPRNLRKLPAATRAKVETLRACSVRDVDWKNITIDVGGRSVQLLDGQGPIEPARADGSASVKLKEVSYGDTNANGREEVFLLVDREEVTRAPDVGEVANELDGLYVLESASDCSMRQLADVVLSARGLGGKPVRGGYDHDGRDALRELRWVEGVLELKEVKPRIARVIR
ncbi:MAG: hypothetical protein ABW252_04040 [Polyangiales bacterium]